MMALPKKYIYRIIVTNHSRQVDEVYMSYDEADVFTEFKRLITESEKVEFPMKYNNEKTKIIESDYELMIIKVREDNEEKVTQVMDDMGKFVDYEASNDSWIILDRARYYKEETFFVYGHHPRYDRKTYRWIMDDLILGKKPSRYSFLTIRLYLNKLVIGDGDNMEIVICKNKSDALRLYNKLEEEKESKRIRFIAFMGDLAYSKYKSLWIDKICARTGWNRKKVKRSSTRP